MLRRQIERHFLPMLASLKDPVVVPLGPVPTTALVELRSAGELGAATILEGLPHPSGANAERIKYFLGLKARHDLSPKTNAVSLDGALDGLRRQMALLRGSLA